MQKDFPSTVQIFLEKNYRSTGAILNASLAIVSEDKSRVQKSLHTSNPTGTTPSLYCFPTEHDEAGFIATEIKRVVANMGGTLTWGDFAVLLRFNALSRAVESALQKEGIPSRILGGHKFFERLEIKDLLSYLQLVDNPRYDPAFLRAVGVPSRGIGEKTLGELAARATKLKLSQFEVVEKISNGRIPDIKPPAKRKLEPFVKVIRVLRELATKGTSPADLIRRLLDLIDYEAHLKKTQPDWETRWENVQELISFATEADVHVPRDQDEESNIIVILDDDEEDNQNKSESDTPLRLFLQASMLSSEGDNQNEGDNKDKVTISTCHAAKGLEWPVVIVPSVEEGTFPFYRTEDVEEERRLLYVACTRAQSLLYLTYAAKRKVAGDAQNKELSGFVSAVTKRCPTLFSPMLSFSPLVRSAVAKVIGRVPSSEDEVKRRVAEFEQAQRSRSSVFPIETQVSYNPIFSRPMASAPGASTNFTKSFPRPLVNDSTHQTCPPINVSADWHSSSVSRVNTNQSLQHSLHSSGSNYNIILPSFNTSIASSSTGRTSSSAPLPNGYQQHFASPNSTFTGPRTSSIPPQSLKPSIGFTHSIETFTTSAVGSPALSIAKPTITRPNLSVDGHRNQNVPLKASHAPLVPHPTINGSRDGITSLPTQNSPSGVKRRLGMGRSATGYSNKKFKPPT